MTTAERSLWKACGVVLALGLVAMAVWLYLR